MIPEDQVTAETVATIFEHAYMEVSEKAATRFSVKGIQFPFLLGVRVDDSRKLIRFADYNRIYRATLEEAAILSNQANSSFAMARFYAFMHEGAVMITTEYDMTFEKGIIPYQIISNFRYLERVAGAIIADLLKDHIRP